jgi:lysophospholipase L1-like esterase
VRVLDLSGLLDEAEFTDEVHPSPAGAQRITRAVAAFLGMAGAAPADAKE